MVVRIHRQWGANGGSLDGGRWSLGGRQLGCCRLGCLSAWVVVGVLGWSAAAECFGGRWTHSIGRFDRFCPSLTQCKNRLKLADFFTDFFPKRVELYLVKSVPSYSKLLPSLLSLFPREPNFVRHTNIMNIKTTGTNNHSSSSYLIPTIQTK